MKHKLYAGDVTLEFDEKKHVYTVDDKVIPSVTGITKIIDKSGPLMWWAVGQCIEHFKTCIGDDPDGFAEDMKDEIFAKDFYHFAARAHLRTSKKAADIGTLVHEWIDDFLRGKRDRDDLPKNVSARSSVISFLEWYDEHVEAVYETEFKVYSREHGYAGTADFDGMVDGERALVDWKTSKSIYPEYEIQGNAYIMAREEELDVTYDALYIIALPKDGGKVKIKRYEPTRKAQDGFLGALALWRALKEKTR